MRITYSDLAQIVHAIREQKEFDGKNDIYEFMDHLDAQGEEPIDIAKVHGVTIFHTEMELREEES
ncbi:hypothetical protein KCG48_05005 [Proteiniclasticum sp. BAD-10]|uniref:Uncharacterized protein n=1 Tax=Proteiniclasticum sediminis TaxID=2804028 RepID=A0A941HPT9_9CLOT|nr:hypothetical protein [Proteiniclasticum sediminis]MBR0575699.1 hypothetical protein [Proteiniclasticum sediminis]